MHIHRAVVHHTKLRACGEDVSINVRKPMPVQVDSSITFLKYGKSPVPQ
jgi:hypothetical protein